MDWQLITAEQPAEGEIVDTCIDAETSEQRNEAKLYRQGPLWFFADGSMYVYYRPTHYAPVPPAKRERIEALKSQIAIHQAELRHELK